MQGGSSPCVFPVSQLLGIEHVCMEQLGAPCPLPGQDLGGNSGLIAHKIPKGSKQRRRVTPELLWLGDVPSTLPLAGGQRAHDGAGGPGWLRIRGAPGWGRWGMSNCGTPRMCGAPEWWGHPSCEDS